jgi:hypothetical protein
VAVRVVGAEPVLSAAAAAAAAAVSRAEAVRVLHAVAVRVSYVVPLDSKEPMLRVLVELIASGTAVVIVRAMEEVTAPGTDIPPRPL